MSDSLQLTINITALAEGLKGALSLLTNFKKQADNILHGVQFDVDTKSIDEAVSKANKRIDALTKPVDIDTAPAAASIDKLTNKIGDIPAKTDKPLANTKLKFNELAMGIYATVEIVGKITRAMSSFIFAGEESELATRKFQNTLTDMGITAPQDLKKINDSIESIHSLANIDDELLQSITAVALRIHSFSADDIPELQESSAGLADAYGVDIATAMQMLARTAEGVPARLSQFGIAVKRGESDVISYTELLDKGSEGYKTLIKNMSGAAGESLRQRQAWGDLKEELGKLLLQALKPIFEIMTALFKFLGEHSTILKALVGIITAVTVAFSSYLIMLRIFKGQTALATLASNGLNASLKANPILRTISIILTLVSVVAMLITALGGWAVVWQKVTSYSKASFDVIMLYCRAFIGFIRDMSRVLINLLTLPYITMYKTANSVFGKIASIGKKLLAGDFAGIAQDLQSSVAGSFMSTVDAMVSSVDVAFNHFDNLGTKASEIWAKAGATPKTQKDGKPENQQTSNKVLSEEEKAALEKAAQDQATAMEDYYAYMKWQAADYESYMMTKIAGEKTAFLKATGDKEKAELQYKQKIIELQNDKTEYINQLFADAHQQEEDEYNLKKQRLENEMTRLENWKNLGLNVGEDLKRVWTDYFELLKSKAEDSEQQYKSAQDNKTKATKESLETLRKTYEADQEAYQSALDKKKQADLKAANEAIKIWKENHKVYVQIWDGIARGWDTMWSSIITKGMTGRDRLKAIAKTIAMDWFDSTGKMTWDWINNKYYELVVHKSVEGQKTAATIEGEATRNAAHKSSVLSQIALDVWSAVKFVAIKMYETVAALVKFFSFLGPFAGIAATASVVGLAKLVESFRKGFSGGGYTGPADKSQIAGVVHGKEFVFRESATSGNVPYLYMLQDILSGGARLADLFALPGATSYRIKPQLSFAAGGFASQALDFSSIVDAVASLSRDIRNIKFVNNISMDPLTGKARELAQIVDNGVKKRKRLS